MKPVTSLSLSLFAALLLLSGCGESGGNSKSNAAVSSVEPTDITVERGPVLSAAVIDAAGQIGKAQGNGVYRFYDPQYPVTSYGGFIDVNRNGVIDAGDVNMTQLQLSTGDGAVMTMATTMAQKGELYTFMQELGLSDEQLLRERPSTDITNAALSDEVYKYCIENNITDPALLELQQMDQIRSRIQDRIETYRASELTQAELEAQLIQVELQLQSIDDETASQIDEAPLQTNLSLQIISTIPATELSNEQKYTLAYMWNEEKLAKDIYLALNEIFPSSTLYNIATRSETSHQASVEALVAKYDLNILNTEDYSGGYSAEALLPYSSGLYSIPELASLYETLYAKGSTSLQDALEVGCMVEVTDINDLEEDIITAGDAADLVAVFQNLQSGSYSHYWSFDSALKAMGVSEGCCVLGTDFCKSGDEYPQVDHGSATGAQDGSGSSDATPSGNGYQGGRN